MSKLIRVNINLDNSHSLTDFPVDIYSGTTTGNTTNLVYAGVTTSPVTFTVDDSIMEFGLKLVSTGCLDQVLLIESPSVDCEICADFVEFFDPVPTPDETPQPTPNATTQPTPLPTNGATPQPTPDATPQPTPDATPLPTNGATPQPTPNPSATPNATQMPTYTPTPIPSATPNPTSSMNSFYVTLMRTNPADFCTTPYMANTHVLSVSTTIGGTLSDPLYLESDGSLFQGNPAKYMFISTTQFTESDTQSPPTYIQVDFNGIVVDVGAVDCSGESDNPF